MTGTLSKLIASTPKLCATDARLLLLHRYESDFGIYNHDLSDDTRDPLALIRMHPKEDVFTGSYLAERLKLYHERHVYDVTHMDFERFLNLPRYLVMEILEYADRQLRDKTKVMTAEGQALEKKMKEITSTNSQQYPTTQ